MIIRCRLACSQVPSACCYASLDVIGGHQSGEILVVHFLPLFDVFGFYICEMPQCAVPINSVLRARSMSERKRKKAHGLEERPRKKVALESPSAEVKVTLLEGAGEASPVIGIELLP